MSSGPLEFLVETEPHANAPDDVASTSATSWTRHETHREAEPSPVLVDGLQPLGPLRGLVQSSRKSEPSLFIDSFALEPRFVARVYERTAGAARHWLVRDSNSDGPSKSWFEFRAQREAALTFEGLGAQDLVDLEVMSSSNGRSPM